MTGRQPPEALVPAAYRQTAAGYHGPAESKVESLHRVGPAVSPSLKGTNHKVDHFHQSVIQYALDARPFGELCPQTLKANFIAPQKPSCSCSLHSLHLLQRCCPKSDTLQELSDIAGSLTQLHIGYSASLPHYRGGILTAFLLSGMMQLS